MFGREKLSRSSRRTTTSIAETSVVEATTDADVSHWRHIFATFLEDASAALGRPHFYLIQANDWQSLCLLAGISMPVYSRLHVLHVVLNLIVASDLSPAAPATSHTHGMPPPLAQHQVRDGVVAAV